MISFAIREADVLHGTRRSESLWILAIGVVRDRQRRIEPIDRVALRAEEEEPAEFGVDVVRSKLHAVIARLPGEVVSKLILSLRGCLRNIHVGADLYAAGKRQQRIRGHAQNRVVEILEVKRKLIQLRRTDGAGVIDDEAVELVVVCVPAGQIGGCGITNLIVGRVVLLIRQTGRTLSGCSVRCGRPWPVSNVSL